MDERDRIYLRRAYDYAARNSDDPRTHNGAILVPPYVGMSGYGTNRFPRDVRVTDERLADKLKWMVHAELDAILNAGSGALNGTLYCPWCPCCDCAKAIIQSGVKKVVAHQDMHNRTPEEWKESIEIGVEMLREAGVEYVRVSGYIGGCENLFRGIRWEP